MEKGTLRERVRFWFRKIRNRPYVTPARKKWWAFKKKLPKWVQWYILGEYHCDRCPMCWSESTYEGDGDCGCFIFGDIREGGCRLLPPFRTLIGWPRKRRAEYDYAHQYDDMGEWYEEQQRNERAYVKMFSDIILKDMEISQRGFQGEYLIIPVPELSNCFTGFGSYLYQDRRDYDDLFYPVNYRSLKREWKDVWARTFKEFFSATKAEDDAKSEDDLFDKVKFLSERCIKTFQWYGICRREDNGMLSPVCKLELFEPDMNNTRLVEAIRFYDEQAHPPVHTTLKEDWSHVLERTWKQKVTDKIMPYLPKMGAR